MENVATRGHLPYFYAVRKYFHANHALRCVELVDSFVILLEFDDWDELSVPLNKRIMVDTSQCISFLLSGLATMSIVRKRIKTGANCGKSLVAKAGFRVNSFLSHVHDLTRAGGGFLCKLKLSGTVLATEAKNYRYARRAKTAKKYHH